MKIDRDEARRIAALAHLEFDDAALDRMAAEMTKILGYIDSLPSPRGERGEGARSADEGQATPLRKDEVGPSVDRAAVEKNAPDWDNGFFVVPTVIE